LRHQGAVEWRKPSIDLIPMGVWCDSNVANHSVEKPGAVYRTSTQGGGG
jgi:hypothetical protein